MARELLLSVLVAVGCNTAKPAVRAEPPQAPMFRIEVTPPAACAHGEPCAARLVLTALGDFHVNHEYPFKFVADQTPGITIDGTGVFAPGDTRTGTLTVTFRADAAGTARITGTFKLSVCTDDVCKIEAPSVAFDVPVT